jgi:hypothetical protein
VKTNQFLRCILAAALLALPSPLIAQQITLSPVLSGLSSPVFAGHAGDGSNRLFIVERGGVIRVMQPGASSSTVFLNISARLVAGGEQGLLGLAFHPQYLTNGRFFVFYTRVGDGTLVIAEYKVSGNRDVADPTEKVILTIAHPTFTNHNGGMLAFGPDGYLYVGVGDGGSGNDPGNNGQNINALLGKILRLNINPPAGSPSAYLSPADNPFAGPAAGRDEIFAYGMRNPWRFSFDRLTGQAWVGDVGQGAREEVDTPLLNGGNYGWRVYEGFLCTGNDPSLCDPADYDFPVFDYSHVGGRCSLTGGYVYRGSRGVLPQGTYIYGDYCSGEIFGWNGSTQSVLLDTTQNISSFGEDEAGDLYVVGLGGTVSRIDAVAPAAWTFTASPSTIQAGQSSVLSFTTTTRNVHNVSINGTGPKYTCNASSCSGSLTVTPGATTTYTLTSKNDAGTPYPPISVTVTVNAAPAPVNVALAANGGVASASSVHGSGYPASGANNGDRKGLNIGAGGVWVDRTASAYPDWLQVDFAAAYAITRIDVFTVQDAYKTPAEPTPAMTFTTRGITAFDVQYWNGSAWVTVPGGSVTGNNKVWRTFTFPAVTTAKVRVLVNNAVTGYSYIAEVEAITQP